MWFLSISLMTLLVFGLYPDAKGIHPLPSGVRIAYQSFCKFVWSICLSFMIYSCISSKGGNNSNYGIFSVFSLWKYFCKLKIGFINTILSWSVWAPLSKLTYAAFLNHITFIMYFYATQEHPLHISDQKMVKWIFLRVRLICHYVFFKRTLGTRLFFKLKYRKFPRKLFCSMYLYLHDKLSKLP